jgi:hypothetical protein
VFLWAFGLLLRLDGILLGSAPSVLVGLTFVITTLAVVGEALRLSITEMNQDYKTRRRESSLDEMSQITDENRANDERDVSEKEAGLAQPPGSMNEVRTGQSSPRPEDRERAMTTTAADSGLWAMLFSQSLCMAESQQQAVIRDGDLAAALIEKEAELLAAEKSLAEFAEALVATEKALVEKDKVIAAKDEMIATNEQEILRWRGSGPRNSESSSI